MLFYVWSMKQIYTPLPTRSQRYCDPASSVLVSHAPFEFPPSLIAQLVVNPQIRRIPETRTKKPAKSDKKEFNDDTLKTTKTRTPSSQHQSWDYGNDEQRETKRDGVYRKILWLHSHCLPRNESSYTNRWVVTSLKSQKTPQFVCFLMFARALPFAGESFQRFQRDYLLLGQCPVWRKS